MGSIPLDNGESVYIHDGTGNADPVAISAAEGSSLANLMKNRERFDYTWANATERGAQTGMVQGSRGYQRDTKAEWLYDTGVWRLALPYVEFTASKATPTNGVLHLVGDFVVDAAASTDTSIATPTTDGVLQIANPGIYSISTFTRMQNGAIFEPATGRTFVEVSIPPGTANILQRVSIAVGEDSGSLSMPSMRVTAASFSIQFYIFKNTALTTGHVTATRVRLARIG